MRTHIPINRIAVPSDLKFVNRQKVLEVFKNGEKQTAMDIKAATGISKPTIMRALQYFCEVGILVSAGLGQSSSLGGKKPEYFVFADQRKFLCISLWPSSITLALSEIVGDNCIIEHFETAFEDKLENTMESLRVISLDFLKKHKVSTDDLYGVQLSTPGTVDYKSNILQYNSKAPKWGRNIPIVEYLKPIFGKEAVYIVENAGKTTGRAVLIDHPELGNQRVLTIFSTWGISACLIENGHVLNGKNSLIGEIGHIVIRDTDTVVCGCGKRGCLENLVSIRRVREMLAKKDITDFNGEQIQFQSLFDSNASGNKDAREVVGYLAHCFAVALHNISVTYNPDVVIFQGDFAWADDYFNSCLKKELSEFRYSPEDGIFSIMYDKRDLRVCSAKGGATFLKKKYFSALDLD